MDKKKSPGSELNQPSVSEDCGEKANRGEKEKGRTDTIKNRDQVSGNRIPKSFGTPCHAR
jgi:hypothetical protein